MKKILILRYENIIILKSKDLLFQYYIENNQKYFTI